MVTAAQLADEVRRSTADTPYTVVDETPDAFALQLDVVDARWRSLLHENSVQKTWRWEVKVDGERFSVADRAGTIAWQAGVDASGGVPTPALRFSASVERGTKVEVSFRKTIGGGPGAVADYSFDSREGKRHVLDAAERLGLRRRMDGATLIGLVAALIAIGGLVVGGIVIGVLALAGAL
jgi:hypothetical protein